MQVNPPYDDVNGEVPNTGKHASIQIQHMEKESITYATTTKVPGSSEITRDKYNGITTNEEQSRTDVYSKVQKIPKTGRNLIAMNQLAVGDEEYDKINFDKSYQAQKAADVYNKTIFCRKEQEEVLENVYNTTEFYHKHHDMDAGNVYDKSNFDGDHTVYDKANFDGEQQNKHSENAHAGEKSASPGQHSTYNYAKAYFHQSPNDERSGDA
ncbi:hypothetical protein CHS0354_032662 [Potamilus streckersoni]|uniref:Uncharacterized protein n=1 Tax=Potamilus streckersoni TaxID=2493646 RepID=A0AAE0TIE4_9BIVA|nr:hypothetical protein CHS0354_032662 [Potamilus streckersoni]